MESVDTTFLTLSASTGLASVAYAMTSALVPTLGPNLVDKGLYGKDMLKKTFRRDAQGRNLDAPLM